MTACDKNILSRYGCVDVLMCWCVDVLAPVQQCNWVCKLKDKLWFYLNI